MNTDLLRLLRKSQQAPTDLDRGSAFGRYRIPTRSFVRLRRDGKFVRDHICPELVDL